MADSVLKVKNEENSRMHRAMKYNVLDSEYHPCSFRDKTPSTRLHRHEPADYSVNRVKGSTHEWV
jgi:hypothetical protein